MTMIVTYTWKDKIVMMSDSRSSAKDDEEKIAYHSDDEYKIIPVLNQMAIGHAGLRKTIIDGEHFDLNKITEHFLEVNQRNLTKVTGDKLLMGLVEMWNGTLSKEMGRNPFNLENRFSFILANFEENENGELNPKIHSYQSHLQRFNWGGNKTIIGDDEVYPIMVPYFTTNTDDWSFEETLNFYHRGFVEVMECVETVGGPIDIYVLSANPNKSFWHELKLNK